MRWRRTTAASGPDPLAAEVAQVDALVLHVRSELYAVATPYRRAVATTALAASVAERTYRVTDALPDLHPVSQEWRGHLDRVWAWLAGDASQHRPLSLAVADHLRSPLHHADGQDGPDDADRPQVTAALAAVLSVLHPAVERVEDALRALHEAVDVSHDQEHGPQREAEVDALVRAVTAAAAALRRALAHGDDVPPGLLTDLRG
ncbi:MAG TPA: hypothetical protein VNU66_02980 [Mycobacteriales bacterium]|nr:hypothetical protein [Mycobacteriales bacterium]